VSNIYGVLFKTRNLVVHQSPSLFCEKLSLQYSVHNLVFNKPFCSWQKLNDYTHTHTIFRTCARTKLNRYSARSSSPSPPENLLLSCMIYSSLFRVSNIIRQRDEFRLLYIYVCILGSFKNSDPNGNFFSHLFRKKKKKKNTI
jgi:hypothetical protein